MPRARVQKPSPTPEGREAQMINLAERLAEERLRDGTASSAIITHYLNLGASKYKVEREVLEEKRKMLQAQTEALQSQKRVEELYANAISAFKTYSGTEDMEID